jgi:acyl carrier protein
MSIEERLTNVFQEVFVDDDMALTDAMTAEDVDGWDSLAHVNLMFAIEQEFSFQFPGNELAEMKNIGALKAYIQKHAG